MPDPSGGPDLRKLVADVDSDYLRGRYTHNHVGVWLASRLLVALASTFPKPSLSISKGYKLHCEGTWFTHTTGTIDHAHLGSRSGVSYGQRHPALTAEGRKPITTASGLLRR